MKSKLLCIAMLYLLGLPLTALNNMPQLAQLTGEHNGSGFGYELTSLDFNHDGYDDLIVLAAFYGYEYQQSPSRGKVYIYYGGPGFSSATEPAMTLEGDYPVGMQRAISSIVNVGDVNGDGFDDLMIGDTNPDDWDDIRYMFYYGGTSDLSDPDLTLSPQAEESGYRFDRIGDVDGDGYQDMGIAYTLSYIMHYDIIWGGTGLRQNILAGIGNPSYFGSMIGIGDVNDDGYDDFAIGYLTDDIGGYNTYQRLYYGTPTRDFTSYLPIIQYHGMATWRCIPLGDLNGDGYDDFFGYATANGMMIWLGSDVLLPNCPDIALTPVYYGDSHVDGIKAGDFNGDGYSDVVGASYSSRRFAVWMGSPSMNGHADWQKTNTLEKFGYDLAVGDFNGDGFDDIAVSAPFEDGIWPFHDYRGYVFVYAGNAGMVANDDPLAPVISSQLGISAYPNPIRIADCFQLEVKGLKENEDENAKLYIYNVKGQLVYKNENLRISWKNNTLPIDIKALTNGIYLCQIAVGPKRSTTKLTIMK